MMLIMRFQSSCYLFVLINVKCAFYSSDGLEFDFILFIGLKLDSVLFFFLSSVYRMGWGVMIVYEPGNAGTRFVMFLLLSSRRNRFVITGGNWL